MAQATSVQMDAASYCSVSEIAESSHQIFDQSRACGHNGEVPLQLVNRAGRKSSMAPRADTPMQAQKVRQRFMKVSIQLCRALSEVTPHQRQAAIAGLSQGLRQELISVREAQKSEVRSMKSVRLVLPKEIQSKRSRNHRTGPVKPCHAACHQGNICSIKTSTGCYHRVRLNVNKVVVASGRLDSYDAAARSLAKLQAAAWKAASRGGGAEAVLNAIAAAGASGPDRQDGLKLSYQAVLDARSCVGRRLHTQTVSSVEEAISLRRQVAAAEAEGAAAVGQAWLRWSQEPRHSSGRVWRISSSQAEGIVLSQEAKRRACTEARKAKQESRKATLLQQRQVREARCRRRCEKDVARRMRCLEHFAHRAEAALKRVTAAARGFIHAAKHAPCVRQAGLRGHVQRITQVMEAAPQFAKCGRFA